MAEPARSLVLMRSQTLVRELELIAPDLKPRTVFFGGGTPSLLNLRQWETILRAMERLDLLGAAEWTVECNPATVSLDDWQRRAQEDDNILVIPHAGEILYRLKPEKSNTSNR